MNITSWNEYSMSIPAPPSGDQIKLPPNTTSLQLHGMKGVQGLGKQTREQFPALVGHKGGIGDRNGEQGETSKIGTG